MATRNIARTVVEGGRCSRSQERESYERERARVRVLLRKVCVDPELADEVQMPTRDEVSDWIDFDFCDKLNPARRWLDSRCGERWDDVYSDVRRRWDVRTTKGRHIVDHIKYWVDQGPRRWPWASSTYVVDEDGVLRRNAKMRW